MSTDQLDDIQTLEQQILGVEYRKPEQEKVGHQRPYSLQKRESSGHSGKRRDISSGSHNPYAHQAVDQEQNWLLSEANKLEH